MRPAMRADALEVQHLLAATSRQRAPSIPDLPIAATAELAGLAVLHLDLIAQITGNPANGSKADLIAGSTR